MKVQSIELVGVILGCISIAAAIWGYYVSRSLKEYRYQKWWLSIIASVISIVSIITISLLYFSVAPDTQKSDSIQSQIARLDKVQHALTDLNQFLSEQKQRLYDTETTIQNLKNEREKLKPLVEADRKTAEALARIIEERRRDNIWKERFFSFFLGIISSLLAGILFRLINTKIQSKRPFVTTIPEQVPDKPKILFHDDFKTFEGWQDYKRGTISHSNEFSLKGNYSLKKYGNNDPNGGYKIFSSPINVGFCFSGWIYRPSGASGGKGDRLAIEDENFNGYGFCVAHDGKWAQIEIRKEGKASQISRTDNVTCPIDDWYQFLFFIKKDGLLELKILDSKGEELFNLSGEDENYNSFDRVVIHGGRPYYVDDIKVEEIEK